MGFPAHGIKLMGMSNVTCWCLQVAGWRDGCAEAQVHKGCPSQDPAPNVSWHSKACRRHSGGHT